MFHITAALIIILASTGRQVRTQQPQIDPVSLELRIHDLINMERINQKVHPLKLQKTLSDVARRHSRDMAARGFFDHINPDGKGPTDRGRAGGYQCSKTYGYFISEGLAENIFQNNLYSRVIFRGQKATFIWNSPEEIAKSTVRGWMTSPGHRQNILNPTYELTGVGIAIAANDQILITQLFC